MRFLWILLLIVDSRLRTLTKRSSHYLDSYHVNSRYCPEPIPFLDPDLCPVSAGPLTCRCLRRIGCIGHRRDRGRAGQTAAEAGHIRPTVRAAG